MVSPHGGAAAHGAPSGELDVPADALVERLRRRTTALERQLDARIAEIAGLQAGLADREQQGDLVASDVDALRAKAAEYDALMGTVTMRVLRRPRAWYTGALRRFPGLARLRPGRH